MLERLVNWLLQGLLELGYPGIVVLMAMESSILPVPSELIMPPAGYWVAQGKMNAVAAVASGVLGSILGALANYWGAHWLGRSFLRRFGKYLLITNKSLERTERYFTAHGEISTFIGRMLPVVRHLISIPAGIARMSLPRFITYTGLGAFIWCSILTYIGYFIGRHSAVLSHADVDRYVGQVLYYLLPALLVLGAGYVWWHRRRKASLSKGSGGP